MRPRARLLLHSVLLVGSAIFLIPFLWLLLTATKEDEELVPEQLRIFPVAPEPRAVSPYLDTTFFGALKAPDALSPAAWGRLRQPIVDELTKSLRAAPFLNELPVDREMSVQAMIPGLWTEFLGILPDTLWTQEDPAVMTAIREASGDGARVKRVFDKLYRRTCLGRASIRDHRFVEFKADGDWQVVEGTATLAPAFNEVDASISDLHYAFDRKGRIRLKTSFQAAFAPAQIKQITIPVRADRSCHRMHISVSMKGKRYESVRDFVFVGSRWSEVIVQEPSADDSKPMQKNWTLIREAGRSEATGDRVDIEISLLRSGLLRAWWGKLSANFVKVFQQVPIARYLWVSVFLACANIILTLFSSSLVAYAFARMEWPGRKFFFVLLLSTLMIPPQVTMIPQFMIFRSIGWYNTLLPLWLPAIFGNAFFIFLLVQAMKGIPKDLTDAARIDGCGFLRIYWHVMLPNVKATLAAVAIFAFMGSWNNFMGPLIYVNDQRLYNLALGLFSFQLQSGGSFSLLMAGSLIMVAPVLLIFFLAQRYFIQGVVMSGVKG